MSHAAEADGSHRHCDHREQERGHGVSTGEHLRLSEEWYRARRVFLQFLAEFQNVIVNGSGRRIILVSPDLPKLRCLPLSTRLRRLVSASAVTTRRKLFRSPLLKTCPSRTSET